MMKVIYSIHFTTKARRQVSRLQKPIRKKFQKQLKLLIEDFQHPSLHTKKMKGRNSWEARIDLQFRFSFELEDSSINILTVGPHDDGLGKK